MWISESTYLPVRVEWTWPTGGPHGQKGRLVGDFRWLKPTKANLAIFSVRIPPGFTGVSPGWLPQVGTEYLMHP